MKILHLSSERTWRGGEQQIAYLIEELMAAQVECIVACKKGSSFEEWCIKNNIKHYALGFKNQFDIKTSLRIKKICKSEQIDLVHMHSSHSHAVGVWASVLGNKPKGILSRRVDFPIKKNFLSRFKYNHSSIGKIICVSDAITNIMQQDVLAPEKCVTIHSGIDTQKFDGYNNTGKLRGEFSIPKETKIIGNISAIAPHKDYKTFVDTVEILSQKGINAKYFIIGNGPSEEEVRKYVKEKGLENQVIFTGFRDDIKAIFKELDVFLITSKTEGLGTTILDAFANRVPVVATAAGGIPEMIIHEKTGMLSNIQSPKSLADNVIKVLEDDTLRNIIIEGAEKKLQDFDKKVTAQKTIDVYNEILRT